MAAQREWFEKDYYKILGVTDKADAKDVTKAYRKLARELHPDANPGNAKAEERFKEVSAAYDVSGRRHQTQGIRRGPPPRPHVQPVRGWRGRVVDPAATTSTSPPTVPATCSAASSTASAAAGAAGAFTWCADR